MKVIGFNGSPRKNGNSATLLTAALEGAVNNGAATERVDLYDLSYRGCKSCFACKRKSPLYGKGCVVKDDLAPILEKALAADAWVFVSPIYNGRISSSLAAFLERLIFPFLNYDMPLTQDLAAAHIFARTIPSGFIYSMNANTVFMEKFGYESQFTFDRFLLERSFGPSESLAVNYTKQYEDYDQYHVAAINAAKKSAHYKEQFPNDCRSARAMGERLTLQSKKMGL